MCDDPLSAPASMQTRAAALKIGKEPLQLGGVGEAMHHERCRATHLGWWPFALAAALFRYFSAVAVLGTNEPQWAYSLL